MITYVSELLTRTLIYIAVFAISLYSTNNADKYLEKNEKKKYLFFSLVAVFLPCIFAGVRSEKVGTDVLVYAKPYFELALNVNSFSSYLELGAAEFGYEFLVYFITKIFGTFKAVLFFTEFLVIFPVYCVAKINRKNTPMWITMFVFFSIFYGASFNFMRQSIAASLLLLGFFKIINKEKFSGIVLFICAQLFHNTAVLGIVMIMLGLLFYNVKKVKTRVVFCILFCMCFMLAVLNWQSIIEFFIEIKIFPKRFSTYIDVFSKMDYGESYYFNLTLSNYLELIVRIICLLLPLGFKNVKNNIKLYNSILMISILTVLIYVILFIVFHTSYAVRFTWYTEYFFIVWLSFMYKKFEKEKYKKRFCVSKVNFLMFSFLICYWLIGYMVIGWHGTLPLKLNI